MLRRVCEQVWLELLKFEVFSEQGEVLRDSFVSVASAGKRDH